MGHYPKPSNRRVLDESIDSASPTAVAVIRLLMLTNCRTSGILTCAGRTCVSLSKSFALTAPRPTHARFLCPNDIAYVRRPAVPDHCFFRISCPQLRRTPKPRWPQLIWAGSSGPSQAEECPVPRSPALTCISRADSGQELDNDRRVAGPYPGPGGCLLRLPCSVFAPDRRGTHHRHYLKKAVGRIDQAVSTARAARHIGIVEACLGYGLSFKCSWSGNGQAVLANALSPTDVKSIQT